MWRINEWALYWVSTPTLRIPEFRQFDSVKSIMRNFPPKGTAGFARQSVKFSNLEPRPPASTSARVSRVSRLTKRPAGVGFWLYTSKICYCHECLDSSEYTLANNLTGTLALGHSKRYRIPAKRNKDSNTNQYSL